MAAFIQTPSGLYVPAAAAGGGGTGLLTNLTWHYQMGEVSGTRADSTAGARTLTDGNTVTSTTGLVTPLAAQFTLANNENLSRVSDAGIQAPAAFTVAGWVKFDAIATNQVVVIKSDGTTAGSEFGISYISASQKVEIRIYSGVASSQLLSTETIGASTWTFLAAQWDDANNVQKIRVNGNAFATKVNSNTINNAAGSLLFGLSGGVSNPFGGALNSWSFWSRILTTADIDAVWNSGAGLPYASFT